MLIGAEAEVAPDFSLGVNRRTFDDFDFILISATHMGAPWFEFDGDPVDSIEARAKAYVRRFEAVFDADIPYHKVGLSHPVGSSIGPNHDLYCKVLDAIPDEEYRRIYGKAAELGIGLEINLASMRNHTIPEMPQHTPLRQPSVFRPYRIAKDVGCKFFIGSDAHFPNEFAWKPQTAETVIDQLDLKESDKFILK
jgi:histidinol phosphatase-like PHP family hydrolase